MVALIALGASPKKGSCHKGVTCFTALMPHDGHGMSMIGLVRVLRGRKIVFDFLPFGIKEVAVRVSPEDFTANEIRRHLFATVA